MNSNEIHADVLIGRRVYALNGRVVGRIEEIRAEIRGSDCLVTEYLIGAYALFERLAAWRIGRSLLRVLKIKSDARRIAWNQLDLSDVLRPRLCCPVAELCAIDKPE